MLSNLEFHMRDEAELESQCGRVWDPERAKAEAQRIMARSESEMRRLQGIVTAMLPEIRRVQG